MIEKAPFTFTDGQVLSSAKYDYLPEHHLSLLFCLLIGYGLFQSDKGLPYNGLIFFFMPLLLFFYIKNSINEVYAYFLDRKNKEKLIITGQVFIMEDTGGDGIQYSLQIMEYGKIPLSGFNHKHYFHLFKEKTDYEIHLASQSKIILQVVCV
jgi:hypothetical protein